MLGAIAGDIIGSAYEWNSVKTTEFPLFPANADFTDDTVMTCAVARAIIEARPRLPTADDYKRNLHDFGRRYPGRGYGGNFQQWLWSDDPQSYQSFGNGSAMRVSPVGFAFDDEAIVLDQARLSALPSHDHPEGIKGAQATALAILLARSGASNDEIRSRIASEFDYDLDRTIEQIRPSYSYDVTCQGSVPESIIAFLDSSDFESAVRNAVSLGGDADTQACVAGGVAEAAYGVPAEIAEAARARLDPELIGIVDAFGAR